ncbi:MAG: hypothetical protein ABEJ77_03410 [Halanaeroarchaeum sp.]
MIARVARLVDATIRTLFERHAAGARYATLRRRYRAVRRTGDFALFVSRLHAASWLVFVVAAGATAPAARAIPRSAVAGPTAIVPLARTGPLLAEWLPVLLGLTVGVGARAATVRVADRWLAATARRRRERIERTLPRAVRYLHVVASGTTDRRALIDRVADRERAFGETARAFARIRSTARVTGSVDAAIGLVARDTPSRETLAPFLLTMRSRAREGPTALTRFLHLESRMLARRGARRTGAARRYLGLVVRLFVALLVLPAVALVAVTIATGLEGRGPVPATDLALWIRSNVLLTPASAGIVLALGALASGLVVALRPPGLRWSRYRAAGSLSEMVRTVHVNPANASVLAVPGAVVVGLLALGRRSPAVAASLAYASFAIPVGIVDWRRARIDAAKDGSLADFLHGVASQVHRGRSFAEAVENVAADADLGALGPDVADLAVDLVVATNDRPVRGTALDRFARRVGTPLAERTVGMIAGALDAGSETPAAFEALQSEAGRLYHEERAVRDEVPIVLAVGWVGSLLVVGIVVAVNVAAIGSTVAGGSPRPWQAPTGGTPTFFLLTQATMLASGWFAGVSGRGAYEALLHSGGLVLVALLAFHVLGLV